MPIDPNNQKQLRQLVKRRHPEYMRYLPHWQFLSLSYDGGRDWFPLNLFRYIKEGEQEYLDRLHRAYRFNHTREVVDLVDKHLFRGEIQRNSADTPDSVQAFWKKATRNGLPIDQFMRQCSTRASIGGRIAVVVDNTARGQQPATKAEEKEMGISTYAYIITPEHMLDWGYDDEGYLNWILLHELKRDDDDPLASGVLLDHFRLWTKNEWYLFEVRAVTGYIAKYNSDSVVLPRVTVAPMDASYGSSSQRWKVNLVESGEHNLGQVPVVFLDNTVSDEPYATPALIADVAYLDRAVANYLSNLDVIIQDQTFSQLVMPAQGLLPGDDGYDKLLEMGTKRIFTYDGEGGAKPEYISPDPTQAQVILNTVNKIINEIYHTVGLAGERTKDDNAVGIDNSSGVAKAYDFERVNSLLTSKADALEEAENRIAYLVALWNGEEDQMPEVTEGSEGPVIYPDNFDVRSLYDEFDIAIKLSLVEAPDGVRQQQMEMVIDKLFPKLGKDAKDALKAALKDWPPQDALPVPGSANPQASQQGQVTDTTDKTGGTNVKTTLTSKEPVT